jgi:tryptophanyl-tRNA synthetase
MSKKVILTGIKPTGVPHIGNYFGAIKPALELAHDYEARYFIADYHALNSMRNPEELKELTYEIAAVWLACGLDPEKVMIYKQSSIPEIFELTTILMAFTPKGLMNRAHAYKAVVQDNNENKKDPDEGVNMGLFTYPALMAADILMFDTNIVPVGRDQKQHIEMAIDIAQSINHNYKAEILTLPEPMINEATEVVTGMDGRKMSKSYNNTIPMFLPSKKLRKQLMKIVTNSQSIEEPKDPDSCNVFTLYKLFGTEEQQQALRTRYTEGGMGWGHAKEELFEVMDAFIDPMRKKYDELIQDKSYIDKVLQKGAERAREISSAKIKDLRKAIGIE